MPSKSDRKVIAILSVCDGALRVLRNEKRFSQVDVIDHVKAGEQYLEYVRENYSHNYNDEDVIKTLKSLDRWAKDLETMGISDQLQTKVLVKIGIMGCEDILTYVKNPIRVEWMTNIHENMEKLDNMVDPEGTAFLSLDKANEILESLYKSVDIM